MISNAVKLLGRSVADVLSRPPFCDWSFEKRADHDLDEPLVYFDFKDHGVDFVCSSSETISSVHFTASAQAASEFELPVSLTREGVRSHFGTPDASGEGTEHPVLGVYGPYDRYDHSSHSVHFEFMPNEDKIKLITLMAPSAVPGK